MVNYVKVTIRKTFQNKIFPKLNSKKHTKLWICAKLLLRNWAKLEFRKRGIGQFWAKWLLWMIGQIVVFSCKTYAQRKKNIAFRTTKIAQKFCEWKPYFQWAVGSIPILITPTQQWTCRSINGRSLEITSLVPLRHTLS